MAFNWQTFRTRTLTAAVFVVVMLAGMLWNQWSFLILFTIIHFGCWWEYLELIEKIRQCTFHVYTKMGLMVIGYGLMLWFCGPAYEIKGYSLKENLSLPASAAGFALVLIGIFQKNPVKLTSFGAAALGLLYISLSWGLLMSLRGNYSFIENGVLYQYPPEWHKKVVPCAIIFSIWVNDTMAYIIGSLIGKNPLSKVSPKKTWEGTIGGIILAMIVAGVIAWAFDFNIKDLLLLSAIAAITGTFGDLLESKLKRMANVKDSGSIMPGHGGFLDRFDSMLVATPFVWLYVVFL
jgi:phosphatidate cytidylyltransferase